MTLFSSRLSFTRVSPRVRQGSPLLFMLLVGALFSCTPAEAQTAEAMGMPPVHRWIKLGSPQSPSLLQVPTRCSANLRCPLVVISHPRAQDAARMRDSARVGALSRALLDANFAVLLSGDGGVNTWGSPTALSEVGKVQKEAVGRFAWNGRIYALGISMGGLLALRSALPGSPYAVQGVVLVDAWVNLRAAWGSALSRRREIEKAYGKAGAAALALDPLPLSLNAAPLPLLVISSPQDTVVLAKNNADLMARRAEAVVSEVVKVTGPHLGGNRFSPRMIGRMVGFFQKLEKRMKMRQTGEFGASTPKAAPDGAPQRLRPVMLTEG